MDDIVIRPDVLNKLKNHLSDQSYMDAIKNSSKFNVRLVNERRLRLPFLDSQTGVAQSDSYIWADKVDRMPGHTNAELYSYPARRWKKKRRQYLMNDNYLRERIKREIEINGGEEVGNSTVENNSRLESAETFEKIIEESKESWFRDFDDGNDMPDAGELDDPESDFDDYEEYSARKKKKKKDTPKRKRVEYSDAEKPFSCDVCGARYKTRPGLSYHYSHSHQNDGSNGSSNSATNASNNNMSRGPMDDEDMPYTPPRQQQQQTLTSMTPSAAAAPHTMPPMPSSSQTMPPQHSSSSLSLAPNNNSNSSSSSAPKSDDSEGSKGSISGKPMASPSQYCDFCLGDSAENKKTKNAEELVSCSDCGRSAHPTCLQFTPNMVLSVAKYRWQCIECKSCGLCGTSDNDDQLLFCDDCDRGYHMYCLSPPLSEPPEGSWSCHLCIEEYHTPKK
ncbi:zinc finger protein ubi-d4-like isoform X2 [Oppia nitens]|uniref:zinc finger protein ubi-d4-like isoform X2 n=1 Tax=Oppia nitens TaxID=1686743 RepID=UPI0023DC034D|nr:zinc finger protein ubi-d4-like isoform X2 [Oppia nitens]